MLYLLALRIGVVARLRAMIAPAAVPGGAYLGWLPLSGTWPGFLGHWIASPSSPGWACRILFNSFPRPRPQGAPPIGGGGVRGSFRAHIDTVGGLGPGISRVIGPGWTLGAPNPFRFPGLLGKLGAPYRGTPPLGGFGVLGGGEGKNPSFFGGAGAPSLWGGGGKNPQ